MVFLLQVIEQKGFGPNYVKLPIRIEKPKTQRG